MAYLIGLLKNSNRKKYVRGLKFEKEFYGFPRCFHRCKKLLFLLRNNRQHHAFKKLSVEFLIYGNHTLKKIRPGDYNRNSEDRGFTVKQECPFSKKFQNGR